MSASVKRPKNAHMEARGPRPADVEVRRLKSGSQRDEVRSISGKIDVGFSK